MADLTIKKRPIWYNLSPVNLPVPGRVSILHRISGLLLIAGIVGGLVLLDLSLKSDAEFRNVRDLLVHPLSKLVILVMAWSFLHHLCAGVRFLLLDVHVGMALESARRSSYAVFVVSLLLTALVGVRLW